MTIPTADSSSGELMDALQLVGSSDALARLLGASSPQVIRWMIGREPLPARVAQEVVRLLAMPSEELANALHITREELEMRRRSR